MRSLIVGIGALGGLVAARLIAAGCPVRLATRTREAATELQATGLRVTGVGGAVTVPTSDVAPLDALDTPGAFDLILLATKALEALEVGPRLADLLAPGGTLLPIQNGAVAQMLRDRLGRDLVLGGLSNLGATRKSPGVIEQRNAGHLLIGELAGGTSDRGERVRSWLGRAVAVRATPNMRGAVWSKLLLNCSVTTIGAIAGCTMREYFARPDGRALFARAYDEALSVAFASGVRPERMIAEPVPPGWSGRSVPGQDHDLWLAEILKGYGDLKPSMLDDLERGRATEIDFLNGYVRDLGRQLGVPTPANAAIVETVHAITRRELSPAPELLARVLDDRSGEPPQR